jgi:hypothetical protein
MHRWMILFLAGTIACSGGAPPVTDAPEGSSPQLRQLVAWIDQPVDEELAIRMAGIGVDRVVVRRGRIDVRSGSPVLRMSAASRVPDTMDIGHWYFVTADETALSDEIGAIVWHTIASSLERLPSEVLLEFSTVPAGAGDFIRRLADQSGIPVILVIPTSQLKNPQVVEAARKADGAVVPVAGASDADLRGLSEDRSEPLSERLVALGLNGVPIRAAIGLRSFTSPTLSTWGEDLNLLTETGLGEVSTVTDLDRKFTVQRALDWSGLELKAGDVVEVRWMDAARLDATLREVDRLKVPNVTGWDLLPFPPPGDEALGISREALFSYFEGHGPAPELIAEVRRSGRTLRVTLTNESPFGTAVSAFGNQLEVRIGSGQLVATDRGEFDRVALGTVNQGEWKSAVGGDVNAVRFLENYIGPGESIVSGAVRLPDWRTSYVVQWRVVLSTGEEVVSDVILRQ